MVNEGIPLKDLKELSQIPRRKSVRPTDFSSLREFQEFHGERHLSRWKHSRQNFVMEERYGLRLWQEEGREINVCGNV